jgi:hypothetical protein
LKHVQALNMFRIKEGLYKLKKVQVINDAMYN